MNQNHKRLALFQPFSNEDERRGEKSTIILQLREDAIDWPLRANEERERLMSASEGATTF